MVRNVLIALAVGSFALAHSSRATAQTKKRTVDDIRPRTPDIVVAERPLSQSLALGRVLTEIGSEDESGPQMFSAIGSVQLHAGVLYIAEPSTMEIRMFGLDGRHLGTFGRRGRGPGEFLYAPSLVHDGDSTLFALQPGSLGITELTTRGAKVTYRRTFGAGKAYQSICSMRGRLYVSAGSLSDADSGIVRELDAARNEVRAFGAPFEVAYYPEPTDAARAMARRSAALLLCDGRNRAIYAIRGDQGKIRRYDEDGALRWETVLPSMQVGFYGADRGSTFIVDSNDFIGMVLPLGATRVLVEVPRKDRENLRGRSRASGVMPAPDLVPVVSYVLDAASGRILSRARATAVSTMLADTLIGEVTSDPWPTLRVRSVRSRVP